VALRGVRGPKRQNLPSFQPTTHCRAWIVKPDRLRSCVASRQIAPIVRLLLFTLAATLTALIWWG
jgi:hypothetical protein